MTNYRNILTTLTMAALALGVTGCNSSDEPFNRNDVTRNVSIINHIVTPDGTAMVENGTFSYTFNLNQMTVGATLRATPDGKELTSAFSGLTLVSGDDGTYSFKSSAAGDVTNLTGVLNFNEGSLRVTYEQDGYKIVASLPELFCLKSKSEVEYSADSVATQTQDDVMYQFEIDPETLTSNLKIMAFTDMQRMRQLNITSKSDTPATVTPTSDGYDITASEVKTTATYQEQGNDVTTTAYPVTNLNAHLDLYNNTLTLTCKLGTYAVTVTGTLSK